MVRVFVGLSSAAAWRYPFLHWRCAREAVDFAYNAAGATAIFEGNPLERRFRDIHTVTQQLQGQIRHFETVGAWMLGVEADLTFV